MKKNKKSVSTIQFAIQLCFYIRKLSGEITLCLIRLLYTERNNNNIQNRCDSKGKRDQNNEEKNHLESRFRLKSQIFLCDHNLKIHYLINYQLDFSIKTYAFIMNQIF